jgi:uncharacterized protein YndB with AHSA1/START domain
MSDKFERVFDLSVDLDRAWKSFTDPHELEAWWAPKVIAFEARPGGRLKYSITGFGEHEGEVLEVRPRQFLRFREGPGHIPGTTEVAVTFEATTSGTRIHIVHSGFGDSSEWLGKLEAVSLGWSNCLADLSLYLVTGVRRNRMFTWRWSLGAGIENTPAGARVVRIDAGGFAARAGLRFGDYVVSLAGAPIFDLSDLWLMCREHAPGEEIESVVVRGGEVVTARATT